MKTVQELLSDRGVLDGEIDKSGQVAGAVTVRTFIEIFDENVEWDNRAVANVLYSLTDIQVRDYAMGLVNDDNIQTVKKVFSFLTEKAPKEYINAPACILASVTYELGNPSDAMLALKHAEPDYSLAQLLSRVFVAGWPAKSFADMRAKLHPQVTDKIFGEEE
jgi:hypothetical protein